MKNLKNLNLQELTIEEQVNTDGGILPLIGAAMALALLLAPSIAHAPTRK